MRRKTFMGSMGERLRLEGVLRLVDLLFEGLLVPSWRNLLCNDVVARDFGI